MTTEIYDPLARYADRLHSVIGDRHHVASPLGAWLLLGLCAPASTGATRHELAEVLGTDATTADAAAAALLDNPHPLVPWASAVWHRPGYDIEGVNGWRAERPRATHTGPLPERPSMPGRVSTRSVSSNSSPCNSRQPWYWRGPARWRPECRGRSPSTSRRPAR